MVDLDLEAAITRVGRERVFARVEALGWSSAKPPPKWVWWMVVALIDDYDYWERVHYG